MTEHERRVAVCGLSHETNTYADDALGTTGLDAFVVSRRGQLIERLAGTRTYVGGILDALATAGVEAVPAFHAVAQPSGTIRREAYESLKSEMLTGLAECEPIDAVVVELHGAAVAEDLDDIEADLACAIRGAVGARPIVGVFDLHGNVTSAVARYLDGLLGVRSYPHVDMYERGHKAALLACDLATGRYRTAVHVEKLPMLLPATFTGEGPGTAVVARCLAAERTPGALDVTFFHGFPWADTSVVGSSVAVTVDGDASLARTVARDVAQWVWTHKQDFAVAHPSPEQAVAEALATDARCVVINETNDNAGGGAPADGTHLLRALVDAGVRESCFGFLYDPAAVQAAIAAGVGNRATIAIGGKYGALGGPPVELDVRVRSITDGRFTISSPMARGVRVDLGPTALLRAGGLDIILTSGRNQTYDTEIFLLHGIDVARYRIVAVKSQNHFRAGFQHLAGAIITSNAPGVTSSDVAAIDRHRARMPMWPRDTQARYGVDASA